MQSLIYTNILLFLYLIKMSFGNHVFSRGDIIIKHFIKLNLIIIFIGN